MAARRRGQETIRDMALSLTVVLVGVLMFAAFLPRGEETVRVVDTAGPLRLLARHSATEVLAPSGLPAYWKATSVRAGAAGEDTVRPEVTELTIGYVVDRDPRTYAQFNASTAPDLTRRVLGERPLEETVLIEGASWDVRRDDGGHVALVRRAGDLTVIVSDGGGKGGAAMGDLKVLAGSVAPVDSR